MRYLLPRVMYWSCLGVAGFAGAVAAAGALQLFPIWTEGFDPIREDGSLLTIEEYCWRLSVMIGVSLVVFTAAALLSLLFRPEPRHDDQD
jgi:hypothetical protein